MASIPPLHRRLADELRQRIATGAFPVGAALPTEAELCRQVGASRGPVRQALATLRAEGLIGGGRGRPPIVRAQPVPQPFETLLSFSRWAEQSGRRPGQRTLEIARRPARAEAADALGLEAGEPVVELLRLRLLDGQPAMVERTSFIESAGRAAAARAPPHGEQRRRAAGVLRRSLSPRSRDLRHRERPADGARKGAPGGRMTIELVALDIAGTTVQEHGAVYDTLEAAIAATGRR